MQIPALHLPRASGSYADTLAAVGLADLVADLSSGSGAEIVVRDQGGSFGIDISPALDTDTVRKSSIQPGFPFLLLKAGDPRAPSLATSVFDYEAERARETQVREAAKKAASRKAKKLAGDQGLYDSVPIDPDLAAFKIYNSMRMGSDTYNQLHFALRQAPSLSSIVANRLEALASGHPPGPSSSEEADLAKAASNLQFWNPSGGKGVARPKPDGTGLGQLSDKLVDWFIEWMRFRALRTALLAYRIDDDFKVYVLTPGDIPVRLLREVRYELLRRNMWGSIKLDILTLLSTAEILVQRSPAADAAAAGDPLRRFLGQPPATVIRGFSTAYFKSLGSATATMNISSLGLPGWFPIDTPERVEQWLSILDEYRRRLAGFVEDHSDHVGPLLAFRDFVSGGTLREGLEFFGRYATLLVPPSDHLIPLTINNMRRVVMSYEDESPGLTAIIENDGFLSLARAIRTCTINAHYHKAQLDRHARTDPLRVEIRYGLAQDWRRVVDREDEFVQKLADFVASFNAEAARHYEKNDPSVTPVSARDLASVLRLIEATQKKKPGLVGRLLIAFGYASDWRQPPTGGPHDGDDGPELVTPEETAA